MDPLLKEWYAARGTSCRPLSFADEAKVLSALRGRHAEKLKGQRLEFCAVCGYRMRGPHRENARAA
jgi:hypothetical protein